MQLHLGGKHHFRLDFLGKMCSNNFKGYCVLNVWFLSSLLIKLDLNTSFELLGFVFVLFWVFFVIISGPERL